jgi:two-component system nitrogen regulation response regulator GlnG
MSGEATILVADDDASIRKVVSQSLARAGYAVQTTGTASALWAWIEAGEGDLVITDVVMPDEDGLDMLPRIRKARPDVPVIVMSARSTMMTAMRATERGAYEYLPKPFDINELVSVVNRALEDGARRVPAVLSARQDDEEVMPIVGRSAAMQDVYRVMGRLTATDLTVLIAGESGTGKELVAKALHDFGRRKSRPFVAVNMAAIPRELIESELFGHEKGAFTGATARHGGKFEQAEGGTLFLDEIGDMPMEAQTRLLRVLQEGEYSAVGSRQSRRADVRIIAATHRSLRRLVDQGLFREDLFYRLNVVPLRLPPLRERTDDIPDLVHHFGLRAEQEGLPTKHLTSEAIDRLRAHPWPGNVRELENLMRRLAALTADDTVSAAVVERELMSDTPQRQQDDDTSLSAIVERHLEGYFAAHGAALPPDGLFPRIIKEVERPLIELSLKATRGNQIKAAALLGLNRNTLRKKIRDLQIEVVRASK